MTKKNIYNYTVAGTASRGQTWEVNGELTATPGDFAFLPTEVIKQSFEQLEQLTQSKAIFGQPGVGCQGPYSITKLMIERAVVKYSVWYMRPEWFREGICYRKPDPANLERTHIHLKDLEMEAPVNLEQVWYNMQGEIWSPNGEARDLIKSKGLRHTSMSVGDVVVVDGKVWLAVSVGFEELGVANAA